MARYPTRLLFVILFFLNYIFCNQNIEEEPEPTLPECSISAVAWSPDGAKIAFFYEPLVWNTQYGRYDVLDDSVGLWCINPDGSDMEMIIGGLMATSLDWHPDGTKLIIPGYEINLADTSIMPIESGAYPRYNHDGSMIVYTIYVGDSMGLWIINTDGTGKKRLNIDWEKGDWAPNGQEIVCARWPRQPTPLIITDTNGVIVNELPLPPTDASTPFHDVPPSISSDGVMILFNYRTEQYLADWQICVIKHDGTDFKQLTNDGGWFQVWNPDGSMIAYCKYSFWGDEEDGDGQLWVMNADGTIKRQLTFVKK